MDMRLQGRTAFVSGSTEGIGYAIASALTAEGVRVTVNGRDAARVEAAVARLRDRIRRASSPTSRMPTRSRASWTRWARWTSSSTTSGSSA
jgi:NAD(P)-dependent dehydrogenase (short-subunit alcohol dehydrogenase family)